MTDLRAACSLLFSPTTSSLTNIVGLEMRACDGGVKSSGWIGRYVSALRSLAHWIPDALHFLSTRNKHLLQDVVSAQAVTTCPIHSPSRHDLRCHRYFAVYAALSHQTTRGPRRSIAGEVHPDGPQSSCVRAQQ
jgi:hypothetical protein